MATALIHFTQGSNTDAAGKAVLGDYGDFSAVTVTNGNNTGVVSWKVYLLDAPPDSVTFPVTSQPQILAQASNGTPTTAFTPDVAGTYRVMLEVTDSLGSVDRDIRCFGIPDRRGFVRPPFQENPEPLPVALPGLITLDPRPNKPDEQNYGSNLRGWAGNGPVGQLDQFFQQYDDLPQKLITSTPYTALVTDPPLHEVNVSGSPVFNLPSAPRVGFVVRVVCTGDPVTVTPLGGGANISGYANDVLETSEGAVYVYQGSNTWQVLSRGLARSRVLPTGTLANQFPVWNEDDQLWELSPGSAYYGGVSVLDYLTGSNTMVEAINDAFADTSDAARQVFFPPGVYVIDAPITSAVAYKSIVFIPGAVLQMTPQAGDIFTVTGANTRIDNLYVNLQTASSATFTAVRIVAPDTILNRVTIEAMTGDIPNATLLRVAEARCHIYDLHIVSDGQSFYRGVHLERDVAAVEEGGFECAYCVIYGLIFDLGAPSADKTYDALCHWRALSSELHNFYFLGGGRTKPTTCITVNGHRNIFYNPRLFTSGATYGIRTVDATAEFLQIVGGHLQGRNNGTFATGSEGISCGHFCGHLKLYATAISGWESGVVFHGSHDSPGFFGAVIANNGTTGGIVIDCQIGPDVWQVSGFTIDGLYSEDANGFQTTLMRLKTGALFGCSFEGGYLGFTNRAVLVEPAFQSNNIVFNGCRISGGNGPATEPGQYSSILFLQNAIDGITALGTGTYASKAMSIYDPVLTGLTLSATGNRITRIVSDIYTANFGTVNAASTTQLNFTYAGVDPTFSEVTATMSNGLGSKLGIVYTWWVSAFNTISGSATNVTGAAISSVSGGVRFTVTTHT